MTEASARRRAAVNMAAAVWPRAQVDRTVGPRFADEPLSNRTEGRAGVELGR